MANINFQFTADAAKVDKALEGLSKKLDSIINKGSQSESVLTKAFTDTALKAEQLQVKIDGIGSAFQRMQAQTQLNNLRANLNTGVLDQFVNRLNQMGVSSERSTTYVTQLATSLGLTRNQLNGVVSAYQAYVATLRIGSEEYINAVANLKILQNTFSELDQSISVSGQNMRSQINNAEAGIRSMSVNLGMIPQQLQNSLENFSLDENISKAKAMFDKIQTASSRTTEELLTDIGSVRVVYGLSFDDMVRHGIISADQLKQVYEQLKVEVQTALKDLDAPPDGSKFDSIWRQITKTNLSFLEPWQTEMESVLNWQDNIQAKMNNIYSTMGNAQFSEGINPFTKVIAEQKLSINELIAILQRLQQTYNNLRPGTEQFQKYGMAIQAVNAKLNQTTQGTMGGTIALQQLGFAVGDAGMMMVNFRGAMMGIGNNLPFIVQGFMQLKQEVAAINASGGAQTTVWKQLVGALKGPAGVLLAVNAVIFALQVLPDIFSNVGASAKNAADQIRTTKNILKEMAAATKESNIMADASVRSTLAEGVAFKELTTRLQSTTAGTKERKDVVDQIQSKYPNYIKNIDLNKASEEQLTKWIKNTTSALYGKIKAMLLEKVVQSSAEALVEAATNYKAAVENEDAIKAKNKNPQKGSGGEAIYDAGGNLIGYSDGKTTYESAQSETKKAKAELNQAVKQMEKSVTLSTALVDSIMRSLGMNPDLANTDPDTFKDYDKENKPKKDKKVDEYTPYEKLSDTWDKIILKEKNSDNISALKLAKATALWELVKKTAETEEEKNKAELDYLQSVKEYEDSIYEKRRTRNEKLFEKMSANYEADEQRKKEQEEAEIQGVKKFQNLKDKIQYHTAITNMNDWEAEKFDMEAEFADRRYAIETDELLTEAQKKELLFDLEKEHGEKKIKLEKKINREKLEIVSNFLGASANLFGKHTAAYAVLAAAQATMDTYKAANLAFSTYPPPFSYIAMGTAIASGLANVKEIWNALPDMPKLAKGGLIDKPTVGLIGEAGPELVSPVNDFMWYSKQLIQSAGAGNGQELSVRVKGEDLVFVLQKAEKKVNRQKVGGKL